MQQATPIFVIIFFFLSFFLYTKFLGPISFSVNSIQTTKANLFSATGIGKATAIPDTAILSLGVTKNAPAVSGAQSQVNTIANKIVKDLKNLGILEKDIKTTNYSVNPQYDYTTGGTRANGYSANQTIEVKVKPIEKVNQAIDTATSDGANIVGGISFTIDDKTRKDLEEKARKEAVANAKEKAESLANAAGIRLGKIVDVQESYNQDYPIRYAAPFTVEKSDTQQTQVSPGENTIQVTITLSYETN